MSRPRTPLVETWRDALARHVWRACMGTGQRVGLIRLVDVLGICHPVLGVPGLWWAAMSWAIAVMWRVDQPWRDAGLQLAVRRAYAIKRRATHRPRRRKNARRRPHTSD